jgi:DNA-binding transcriptional LysR family regulator
VEISQLKYFLAIARHQSFHAAARELRASLSSLTHAAKNLEVELGIKLFTTHKQRLQITPSGLKLQKHALDLIAREEEARRDLIGSNNELIIRLAGQEVLFSRAISLIETRLKRASEKIRFIMTNQTNLQALASLDSGDAHIAVVTAQSPSQYVSAPLLKTQFKTCVGKDHPLAEIARESSRIRVEELLKYDFASCSSAIFGNEDRQPSPDGWRDDIFPRSIKYRVDSLNAVENLVKDGKAVAYLPDFFAETSQLIPLKISGCPYTCEYEANLVGRKPIVSSWMHRLF